MNLFSCVLDCVKDPSDISIDETEPNSKSGSKSNSVAKSLLDSVPTELLIKIFSYMTTRDKVTMRYVSRKFRDATKTPSMWKEFVWPNYEPHHVCIVSNVLKEHGEHVRRIFFPAHVTPTKVLEMARCCTKVTHLSLPKDTQLSMDHLEDIVHGMTCLQQLDVFNSAKLIQSNQRRPYIALYLDFIDRLLKVAANLKELKLRIGYHDSLFGGLISIKNWADKGNVLPSVISILTENGVPITSQLFDIWSTSNAELPSFEIGLYDNKQVPMNLYPPTPLSKFRFGPAATPPLIQLSNYGIVGLQHDVFYLNEYDHYGTVKHTVIPSHSNQYKSPVNEKHFHHVDHLHSVSYVDISLSNVHSNHLEQLAVVCPNLQRLNIKGNDNCLKDLGGFRAIVRTCQNLEGLNLAGISMSSVESQLSLWELLSSLKKLTHLAIDLCAVMQCDQEGANKGKLVDVFKSCHDLTALEIHRGDCQGCTKNAEFLFSHFPSLRYCRMCNFEYTGLAYAIANCHQLKYLSESFAHNESSHPLPDNCQLQQLHIISPSFDFTMKMANALSIHGELECAILYVNPSTIDNIMTLINNSPNLILLQVFSEEPTENRTECDAFFLKYEQKIKEMFSNRKLVTTGRFKVCSIKRYFLPSKDIEWLNTNLNSLWSSIDSVSYS